MVYVTKGWGVMKHILIHHPIINYDKLLSAYKVIKFEQIYCYGWIGITNI